MTHRLYSAWYCPFAQRTWIALEQLGLDYTYSEVDPYDKTDQWMRQSRGTGQVPVLEVERKEAESVQRIPDSMRTMEYLDAISGGKLFPKDPASSAETRFWLDHVNGRVIPLFYRTLKSAPASEELRRNFSDLVQALEALLGIEPEEQILDAQEPSVLDIALYPFVYRMLLLLPHYKDLRFPSDGTLWTKFHHWFRTMSMHSCVRKSFGGSPTYEADLKSFYSVYATGGGQDDVTRISQ